jgi:prolyl oligopeptidase
MLAWLLLGGHYGTAIVRGDGNLGADQQAAGRGHGKWRSVEDLVSLARYLIDTGVTAPGRLGLLGFSAGGLLAAGAAIHFGQSFAACVCVNPVADLLRFPHLVGGRSWTTEFGDPETAADHAALERLSPYHAVRPGRAYPDFLICQNSADDRVDPAHGRKLCAALLQADRAADGQPGGGPGWPRAALLREDHGGHAWMPQQSVVGAVVDLLAFFGERLGLPAPPRTAARDVVEPAHEPARIRAILRPALRNVT